MGDTILNKFFIIMGGIVLAAISSMKNISFKNINTRESTNEKVDSIFSKLNFEKNKTIYSIIADEESTIEIVNKYDKNSEEEKEPGREKIRREKARRKTPRG